MTPRVYVPSSLRAAVPRPGSRPEAWGIGHDGALGAAMLHGPFRAERDALEVVGDAGLVVVHFLPDGTDVIAWRWSRGAWREATS